MAVANNPRAVNGEFFFKQEQKGCHVDSLLELQCWSH